MGFRHYASLCHAAVRDVFAEPATYRRGAVTYTTRAIYRERAMTALVNEQGIKVRTVSPTVRIVRTDLEVTPQEGDVLEVAGSTLRVTEVESVDKMSWDLHVVELEE
jgi:hypothetical protein